MIVTNNPMRGMTHAIEHKDEPKVEETVVKEIETTHISAESMTEIAKMVSSMKHAQCSLYYCDEKFSFIHTDLEKAILSLMIDSLQPNDQLFFTTHNTDILNMNLPKHSFTFLCKDISHTESPVSCISASTLLKRNTDSLKNAVDNDMFACAPAVDLIYEIASL